MREMTYGWNLEMQMRAARAGLRILELPVPHGRRLAGKSKVAGNLPRHRQSRVSDSRHLRPHHPRTSLT